MPPQGNVIRVSAFRTLGLGGMVMNTFCFNVFSAWTSLQAIAESLTTNTGWVKYWNQYLVGGTALDHVYVECLTDRNLPTGSTIKSGMAVWGSSSQAPQVAMKIRLRNQNIGSRHHGKLYTPTPIAAAFATDGSVSTGAQGTFDAWKAIVTPLYVSSNASSTGLGLCWWHNRRDTNGTFTAVETMELVPFFSTVRSRRPGVGR